MVAGVVAVVINDAPVVAPAAAAAAVDVAVRVGPSKFIYSPSGLRRTGTN